MIICPIAIAVPGPFEIFLLCALFGVPLLLIVVLLRMSRVRQAQQGFPILPAEQADGPGRYRVRGVDQNTRADREETIEADSRANAQVKAELEGMIVTDVVKSMR